MWTISYHKQARKDARNLKGTPLQAKAEAILAIIAKDPFLPPYEKLQGDLAGFYSRRINIKHRLVYQVIDKEKTVKVIRMWTHYEN